jgi:hypothetical protein
MRVLDLRWGMLGGLLMTACTVNNVTDAEGDGGGGSPLPQGVTWAEAATWPGGGTGTLTCPGYQPASASESSDTPGFTVSGSALSLTVGGCDFTFSIDGDTATLDNAPVTCMFKPGDTEVVSSYTYVLSAGALTGTEVAAVSEDNLNCNSSVSLKYAPAGGSGSSSGGSVAVSDGGAAPSNTGGGGS